MLPMLPAVVENCAECTYPLPEELSIGLLFFGEPLLTSEAITSFPDLSRREYRGDPLHFHRSSFALKTNWRPPATFPPFQSFHRRSPSYHPLLLTSPLLTSSLQQLSSS
jgi:hypothetical protein